MSNSEELEVVQGTDIERIFGDVLPDLEDPEEIQRKIAAQILAATDLAGVFRDDKTTATKDIVGVPLTINDCKLMQGEIDGQAGVYMLIDAVRFDDGEVITLNTGAAGVMSRVWRMKQLGVLPVECSVAEAGPGRPGRSAPLTLKAEGDTLKLIQAAAKSKQ